jgi:hypothetical protein
MKKFEFITMIALVFFIASVTFAGNDNPPDQTITPEQECIICVGHCQADTLDDCEICKWLACYGFGARCEVATNDEMADCCLDCRSSSGAAYCAECPYITCPGCPLNQQPIHGPVPS